MARFDPATYPDRLAFEANARRIRTEELGKAFDATLAWLKGQRREPAGRLARFWTALSAPAHRHSPR